MTAYKRGNKYWVGFRFDGKRYRRRSPENSMAGAKAYEAHLRQRLSRGDSIDSSKQADNDCPSTFSEFSQQWMKLDVQNNNKHSEVENKTSILKNHINPFFGSKRLTEITSLDVEKFKGQKLEAGFAHKTINNFLIVLSRCLKMAHEWQELEFPPKVKLLKVQPQKYDYLTEAECRLLLNSTDGMLHDMILVALKTGVRFGELIALEWVDIDSSQSILTVKSSFSRGKLGSTKSNKIRFVPLLEEVAAVFASNENRNRFVFSEDREDELGRMRCLRWLQRAGKKAGLRKIGWHTLRHTFASHLAQRGVSVMIIKELLGHADIRTTMRYAHLNSLATRNAVSILAENAGHNMATLSGERIMEPLSIIASKNPVLLKAK